MSFFGNSSRSYSTSETSSKVKRQLSIDLNLTKRKRGLSLVSVRAKGDQNAKSSQVVKKDAQTENKHQANTQFPHCTFPTCNLKTLSLLE